MVVIHIHFVGLLLVFVLVCKSNQTELSQRVVNGQDVAISEMPWVVSVRKDNAHICCGNIISNRHILTAGSCVSDRGSTSVNANRMTARVGSVNIYSGGHIIQIKNISIHEHYGNFMNNLAIMTTAEPLTFNEKVQQIHLQMNNEEIVVDSEVVVSGWGVQSQSAPSYKLQKIKMTILSASECSNQVGFGYESVICLKHLDGQGVCRGDVGGAIIDGKNQLVGVVSFAFGGCATKYPDISSRIPYYKDWINNIINS